MSKNRLTLCRLGILFLVCVVTSGIHLHASPQEQDTSWQLNRLKEKLVQAAAEKKAEWKHTSVTPMQGSRNTITEQWSQDGLVVRIAAVEYPSEGDATAVLRKSVSEGDGKAKSVPFGDEGYSWNHRGAIAFRKGDVLIFVTATSLNDDDPTVLTSDGKEAKAVREFAKHASDALAALK